MSVLTSWVLYPVWQHTFVSPSTFSRRAVVSYWRKYVHEVLVNRLGGLSLPRKSVVRLTDRPDMTLDVYRGCKTTIINKLFNTCIHLCFLCYFCHNKQLFHYESCMKLFTHDFCKAFEILLIQRTTGVSTTSSSKFGMRIVYKINPPLPN